MECVVNVSEGQSDATLNVLRQASGPCLLDVHRDADHHRSVFTLAGPPGLVEEAIRALASSVVEHVDLRHHHGVHPRIGALDVVPFVPLALRPDGLAHQPEEPERVPSGAGTSPGPANHGDMAAAVEARDRFARWAAKALDLPCFLYGPSVRPASGPADHPAKPDGERSLPEIRRRAWHDLQPDTGPPFPHPSAGACAVGARSLLIAYNLWLDGTELDGKDLDVARRVAAEVRGPRLRTLGLAVRGGAQVSCNLIAPEALGPAAVFDAVASRVAVARAELVGLLPRSVLQATPAHRWEELAIGPSSTIEARLEEAGLDGGRFPSGH